VCSRMLARMNAPREPSTGGGLLLFGNSTWTSPYVLSCFVTLREKGLPFQVEDVALHTGAHFAPAFAAQSLTSRVPVLVDGDLALSESSAIVEYLEDRYAPPEHARVLPADLRARARARQIMAWLRSDLMPIREERSAEYVFYDHERLPTLSPLSAAGLRATAKLFAAAERLVPEDAGPLFGAWCIADNDLAMMLQRLARTGHDVPKRLREYAERQWDRPSVAEFLAHARPDFASARMG
jgi:glutathione S-transferase